MLTAQQKKTWDEQGFLHIPDFFSPEDLANWTHELTEWPETPGKWMKYFERSEDGEQDRMLCRVEYFLAFHEGWRSVIHDPRLMHILGELFGEPAILFKEKLNFKLPGGNGFTAHQDAPAFASFGQDFHITAMVSVDATTVENGCLEMAAGRHKEGVMEMTEDLVLSQSAIDSIDWSPLETQPGDLVLFGSIIPHRSPANRTMGPRRAAYITYNGVSQGDFRDAYYTHKREVFPPEVERVAGKDYSNTGLYNIGNPIRE